MSFQLAVGVSSPSFALSGVTSLACTRWRCGPGRRHRDSRMSLISLSESLAGTEDRTMAPVLSSCVRRTAKCGAYPVRLSSWRSCQMTPFPFPLLEEHSNESSDGVRVRLQTLYTSGKGIPRYKG